jgi:hypothetical protein
MRPWNLVTALAALGMLVGVAGEPAHARPKQTQTEANFLSYDAEASTVTVKVRKPGKGARPPRHLKLKRGKEAVFKVKLGGSVLTSTIVKTVDGRRGAFADLQPGVKIFVFWVPDEKDKNARFARSISVYVPPEEWGKQGENQAANAAGD